MAAHVRAGNRPVGVVGGLIIDHVRGAGADGRGMLCKIVGGSPEHPTVMQLSPEELKRAVWTVSRPRARPWTATGLAIIGAENGDGGAGATPWIAGGILVGLAIAVKAAEKRFA